MNGHQNEAFSCLIGALNSPRKVNGYGADYAPFAKSVDFVAERCYYQTLNVNEQNAYLHVRGHNLFELVAYIGDLLCRGTSLSFKKDVLINDLSPQTYWQIQNITKDLSIIIQ